MASSSTVTAFYADHDCIVMGFNNGKVTKRTFVETIVMEMGSEETIEGPILDIQYFEDRLFLLTPRAIFRTDLRLKNTKRIAGPDVTNATLTAMAMKSVKNEYLLFGGQSDGSVFCFREADVDDFGVNIHNDEFRWDYTGVVGFDVDVSIDDEFMLICYKSGETRKYDFNIDDEESS